ncbi:MAG: holo-[acyl-carrier-protein] synthase, partial [Phototrophicales bacterium]
MLRCGIDMIEIARVQAGIDRFGERWLNRFFTPAERADCEDQPHRLAARLAAKEAVAKAFGTGIGDIGWREIEIQRGERGRPILALTGRSAAAALIEEFNAGIVVAPDDVDGICRALEWFYERWCSNNLP